MRSFPRTSGRRLAAGCLAVLVAGGLTAPLVAPSVTPWALAADDKLKKKQKKVQQQIAEATQSLEGSSAAVNGAAQALTDANARLKSADARLTSAQSVLKSAQAKLATAQATLAETEAKLAAAQAEDTRLKTALQASRAQLTQARTDLVTGQQAVATQQAEVKDVIADILAEGDPQLIALGALLNADSAEDVLRQQELTDTVVSAQNEKYQALRAAEVVLDVRQQQVQTATEAVATERKQAAANLKLVAKLQQQAATARDQVAATVAADAQARQEAAAARADAATAKADAATAKAAAEQAKTADQKVLDQLKAEEEKIKQQILAQAKKDPNRNVGSTSGMFARPVSGYVTSPYGWRIHPIYGYWGLHDGTDFHAPCGTPEIAVETGTVTNEYYSSVWGNRLYLNLGNINGHNYTVIYNHISTYRAHEGDVVARGETVAYAGTTGWSTGCHLHFTVLKDGDPIDPMTVM
ncbi:peptidoglycan DD-metalloendopeptidase family protein [Nocardioides sp.]|uniref:peptidoglycan DD-metalloendopeptidase family protein n=1 Tax=Nocardioides sp. TaxID=35761 RepID=UPI0039E6A138